MEIVYAAEKPTIADVLSNRLHVPIGPQDIEVYDNPEQTGSFLVYWRRGRYLLSPGGQVVRAADGIHQPRAAPAKLT